MKKLNKYKIIFWNDDPNRLHEEIVLAFTAADAITVFNNSSVFKTDANIYKIECMSE